MPENQNFAHAAMLIRAPRHQVFEAFVNPVETTRFWFTKSSGHLVEGQYTDGTWEMYNVTATAHVLKLDPDKMLRLEWGDEDDNSVVEWTFEDYPDGTFVTIVASGFDGTPEEILEKVRDNTGGYSLVLAGCKAWLEHGLQLNLVLDRFPTKEGS